MLVLRDEWELDEDNDDVVDSNGNICKTKITAEMFECPEKDRVLQKVCRQLSVFSLCGCVDVLLDSFSADCFSCSTLF